MGLSGFLKERKKRKKDRSCHEKESEMSDRRWKERSESKRRTWSRKERHTISSTTICEIEITMRMRANDDKHHERNKK